MNHASIDGAEIDTQLQISLRLKGERERLGYTINSLSARLLVTKGTQIKYENGSTLPTALYLARFDRLGADVLYIVTGDKAIPNAGLSRESDYAVNLIGSLDPLTKQTVLLLLERLAKSEPKGGVNKMTDAEMWRATARSIATSDHLAPNVEMSLAEFLDIIDRHHQHRLTERQAKG